MFPHNLASLLTYALDLFPTVQPHSQDKMPGHDGEHNKHGAAIAHGGKGDACEGPGHGKPDHHHVS